MHCSYLLEEEGAGLGAEGVNITRNLAMCMLPAAKLRSTMGETERLDRDQVFRNFCEGGNSYQFSRNSCGFKSKLS